MSIKSPGGLVVLDRWNWPQNIIDTGLGDDKMVPFHLADRSTPRLRGVFLCHEVKHHEIPPDRFTEMLIGRCQRPIVDKRISKPGLALAGLDCAGSHVDCPPKYNA